MRTLGEKKNYKYLGILEVDTMKQMDQRIRKLKMMYEALHLGYDLDCMCQRNESGRGRTIIQDSFDALIKWFAVTWTLVKDHQLMLGRKSLKVVK